MGCFRGWASLPIPQEVAGEVAGRERPVLWLGDAAHSQRLYRVAQPWCTANLVYEVSKVLLYMAVIDQTRTRLRAYDRRA